jgi:hypothetical protein
VNVSKSSSGNANHAAQAIGRLLERIAAILVRLGLDSPQSERWLRRAFVQAAIERAQADSQRPTQARIASYTGLSRLEVRTILNGRQKERVFQSTRVDQVVVGWRTDPQFLDTKGRPLHLQIRGSRTSFERLVKKYGRDVTARTLREDLIRKGIVRIRQNKLVLLQKGASLSRDALAAHADIKFLASHLASIDFQLGRRSYVLRQSAISADDKRAVEMLKRIAVARLDTVFNSLAAMSLDSQRRTQKKRHRPGRLFVTAVVATEAEDKQS